ncbi:flagellar hook assembly protein FlgD [Brevibacillus fluminis]|uniref:flagellar hook assembly protein FlgD n=1 Tax=Brevibacillus fluminis TaxID=511487 RepID=UPI003F8BB88D
MADSVTNTTYVPEQYSYKNKKEADASGLNFDSNSFMKLLIEQLKNQDPLSPMDNQQFVQQTSLMAMVERLTKMEELMEESNSSLLNVKEYEGLIGKDATYSWEQEVDGELTKQTKTGAISAVKMVDGKVQFQIDGNWVTRDKITGIESKSVTSGSLLDNTLKYSQLIGKQVTYKESQSTTVNGQTTTTDVEKTGVVSGISLKDNQVELTLDDNKKLPMDKVTGMNVQGDVNAVDNNLKYAQMIGYGVTYQDVITNTDGSSSTNEATSTIKAVSMKNGLVEFVLADGKKVKPSQITGYSLSPSVPQA